MTTLAKEKKSKRNKEKMNWNYLFIGSLITHKAVKQSLKAHRVITRTLQTLEESLIFFNEV